MKFTDKHKLPDYLESYLKRFYKPDPHRLGVTTLIDESLPRYLLIKHWDEMVVDVSEFLTSIKGQGVHHLFQDKLPKIEIEKGGFTIVGEADKEFLNNLIDIKVTSVWTLIYKSRMLSYEKQLNVYDWMKKQKYGKGFNKLFVDMFFDDWKVSKTMQRGNHDYPKILFKRVEIKKWTTVEQEAFVTKQLQAHKTGLNKPIECSREGKWQSADTYAVKRKGRKSAVRVFDTRQEAEKFSKKTGDFIEERKGECKRCNQYCLVNNFCPFYQGDF